MRSLYSTGCQDFLGLSPQNATSSPLYLDCVVLTRGSSYSALTTSCLVAFAGLLYRYILTPAFFRNQYQKAYSDLQPRQRRAFQMDHIDFILKTISLMFSAGPVYLVLIQGRHWSDSCFGGSNFKLGDSAFFATAVLSALFLFQLLCEERLKFVDTLHHYGGLLIIQGYAAWNVSLPAGKPLLFAEVTTMADICLLWLVLSDAYGFIKTGSLILRRCLQPATMAIERLYILAFCATMLMTILEAAVVLYAAILNWDKLSTLSKVTICVLQGLFTLSKYNNNLSFNVMYKQSRAKSLEYSVLPLVDCLVKSA